MTAARSRKPVNALRRPLRAGPPARRGIATAAQQRKAPPEGPGGATPVSWHCPAPQEKTLQNNDVAQEIEVTFARAPARLHGSGLQGLLALSGALEKDHAKQ